MEFIKKERTKKKDEVDIEQRLLNWPDCYYKERSAVVRKQLLDEADARGLTPEDNAFRRELYEIRYLPKRTEDGEPLDSYIKAIFDLRFMAEETEGIFRKLKPEKLDKVMNNLGFLKADTQARKNLLFMEIYHLGMLYSSLCAEDKTFNSMLLGVGRISEDKQAKKIANEYYRVAYKALDNFGGTEKYALFRQAMVKAYTDMFPDYEELFDE